MAVATRARAPRVDPFHEASQRVPHPPMDCEAGDRHRAGPRSHAGIAWADRGAAPTQRRAVRPPRRAGGGGRRVVERPRRVGRVPRRSTRQYRIRNARDRPRGGRTAQRRVRHRLLHLGRTRARARADGPRPAARGGQPHLVGEGGRPQGPAGRFARRHEVGRGATTRRAQAGRVDPDERDRSGWSDARVVAT